jgi:hypothetical protein
MPNSDVELMYKNIVFMMLLILAKVIDRKFYKFYLWVLYIYSISAQRWYRINVEEICFVLYLPNGDIEWNIKKLEFNVGNYCWIIFRQKSSCFRSWRQKRKRKEKALGSCDSDDKKPKHKLCIWK